MGRHMRIANVTFGQTALPLPVSARLSRCTTPRAYLSDGDVFTTSVEISPPSLTAEVRIRDTATAEDLSLGQQGDLTLTVLPTGSGGSSREITLSGAVLIAVELTYEQSSMATALLRFAAESDDGQQDPFSAEDAE